MVIRVRSKIDHQILNIAGYLGCFYDDKSSNRVLPTRVEGIDANNTPVTCKERCWEMKLFLSAVQWRSFNKIIRDGNYTNI